jgi:hypothetical protein
MSNLHIEHVDVINCSVELDEIIKLINKLETNIMATINDVVAQLDAVVAQSNKILSEVANAKATAEAKIGELQVMIADLQAQLANNQPIDLQPLVDKIANEVLPALTLIDEVNPDA